jgi:transcriptional regulator with XRE-family HTH domain
MDLHERLEIIRGDRSQRAWAKTLGASSTAVRRYLSGEVSPPADFLAAVCRADDIDPAWLLLGDCAESGPAAAPRSADAELASAESALRRVRAAGDGRCWQAVLAVLAVADPQGGASTSGEAEVLARTA